MSLDLEVPLVFSLCEEGKSSLGFPPDFIVMVIIMIAGITSTPLDVNVSNFYTVPEIGSTLKLESGQFYS